MLFRTLLCTILLAVAMPCRAQTEAQRIQMELQSRVYVEQSGSWAVGGWSPFFGLLAAGGGARPQTAEVINTFTKRCPSVTPTIEREKADYVVILEHEGGKSVFRRDNKYPVFTASGDLVKSGSTRMLGNAVGEACQAITGKAASR